MTDLIDRQALLERLNELRAECVEASKTYGDKDPLDEDELEVCAKTYDDAIKVVEEAPTVVIMTHETVGLSVPIPPPPIEPPEPEEVKTMWINRYVCPECKHEWTDIWPAQCDDDCQNCGARHISPTSSEETK